MIQKKVCMVGTFAVGKTSLVRRFVESIYSDKYHTTVGVKIDKKVVQLNRNELTLVLWDIEGSQTANDLRKSYLRGAAGYLLVIDGTRQETLSEALELHRRVTETIGVVPFLLLMNKADLTSEWSISEGETSNLRNRGWEVMKTSAKTGFGVEDAFRLLAQKLAEA
ncbi:MAG TPA: Rab family GTPase [Pyrinomonadaceae bacterium]|nr:Rab family GTPase [Pyrinomonadaceae bacterium]